MQRATHRMTKGMKANEYDKHAHKEMVECCSHLTTEQKYIMNTLFSKLKKLFSGKLGHVPGPPVKFKFEKEAKPFYSRAYTVPKAFETMAKKEVQDLVDVGVLVKNVEVAYCSPSFFRKKKDGGIRFVSDLRKLDPIIQR